MKQSKQRLPRPVLGAERVRSDGRGPEAPSPLTALVASRLAAMGSNPNKLAEALGMNTGYVYNICRGVKPLSRRQVPRWASALGIEEDSPAWSDLVVAAEASRAHQKRDGRTYVASLEIQVSALEEEVLRLRRTLAARDEQLAKLSRLGR